MFLSSCGGDSVSKPSVLVDAEGYTNDGIQAYSNAQWSKAKHLFNKALLLYQGMDNQKGVLLSTINLAEVSLAVHDHAQSKQYLTHTTRIAAYDLFQHYSSRISLLYAVIALQQKQLAEAEQILRQILPEFDNVNPISTPDSIQIAAVASQTKIAFLKKHNELLWTRRYENVLQKTANKSADRVARLLRFQATLLLQQGAGAENKAETMMQQALALYKENLSRAGIAATLLELAQFYRTKHRWQEAKDYLNRSKAVYNFLGDDGKVKLITSILVQGESTPNQ